MENTIEHNSTPWKNGYYLSTGFKTQVIYVEGEHCSSDHICGKASKQNALSKGTWKYGDYGEAHPDVVEKTGKNQCDVEMDVPSWFMKIQAVLSDDGKTLTFHNMIGVNCLEWKSEEEVLAFQDTGDSVHELLSPHKLQPDRKGKLLWISGPPGMGKSTSALFLSKKLGYVYYEGDFFMMHSNPYLASDIEEPIQGFFKQNFLKGVPQERIDAVHNATADFMAMLHGNDYNMEPIKIVYKEMCKEILKERNRLGGDWAVAQAIPTRQMRDYCKELLGSDLIFVVLNMSEKDQVARVTNRLGGDIKKMKDLMVKAYSMYEPACEGELNAINIYITKEMTRDDVIHSILQKVQVD